jgi:N-acetylneuraminate synthase/N,N'-diacetyllegionaminate synthase
MMQPKVTIGPRLIGPAEPLYVIAEAGVNHNGSVETARRLVDAARAAGADAVKFQAFKATRLASRHAEQAAYQKGSAAAASQVEMLAKLELTSAEFARLKRHCDAVGIEFLATPFGLEDLRALLDLGVRAIKIASPDIINRPLLEAAAGSRLPVLLSTGASEQAEIDAAHDLLGRELGTPLVLLHCVSTYPAPMEQANLRRITALLQRYGCPVGYSDHTQGVQAASLAVAAGACVLEKHFTLDRAQPGPDHAFSLTPGELAEYVRLARSAQVAMGNGLLDLSDPEREVRKVSRCSVTASRDIPAGTTITGDMLIAKRPGTGISPWDIAAIPGRRANCDIPADTPITRDMLG